MRLITGASLSRSLAVFAISAGIAACSSSNDTAPATATGVSYLRQSDSITTAGMSTADTLMVNVVNPNSEVAGATVTWSVVSGSATLANATSISDALGNATMTFVPGTSAGPVVVTATVGSLPAITFNADVVAGAAHTVAVASGDAQSGTAGTALAAPCVVKVTDQYGNVVSGATVAWATSGAGALSAATSTTDSTGMASSTLTLDATAGAQTVTATVGTLTAATFTETGM